ncbi:Hydroxypyruvate isomerase [Roseivivax sp. THAF40]|uniref:hydroxypyruvate isomerase family protein n=1 Tax=unclassified Roseivivax TaxID=2639302 RepID=UPI0012691F29|nr:MULTISPECIES: TIM barrel protein [unclassified Roseivivax]QFS84561.1 Hydroxypyruvate isomerase [Roseivivax sp. THAF197b]QFT48388.1 Hydroxypyruvate isomerase [Roseivivax sp. THAF40]
MKIAANISLLTFDVPLVARPDAARAAGFDGVECLFPYVISAQEMNDALNGMPLVLINTPVADWDDGARGRAAVPGEVARFAADMHAAIDFARATGTGRIHAMAGKARGADALARFKANLRAACLAAPDLTILIEPLNPFDVPGYFLNDFDQAAEIIGCVGLSNLGLQFDAWHAKRIHGDVAATWTRHADLVRHVQIGGFDARGAPDPDAPEEVAFYDAVAESGYDGWISAEYFDAGAGYDWLRALRARVGR